MSYTITETCIGCTACTKVCPTAAISGEKKEQHVIEARLCIECGACGRICPKESVLDDKGQTVAKLKKSEWPKPIIDEKACYACENCVAACPVGALTMLDEELPLEKNYAILAHPEKCITCGWCVKHCVFDAITLEGF